MIPARGRAQTFPAALRDPLRRPGPGHRQLCAELESNRRSERHRGGPLHRRHVVRPRLRPDDAAHAASRHGKRFLHGVEPCDSFQRQLRRRQCGSDGGCVPRFSWVVVQAPCCRARDPRLPRTRATASRPTKSLPISTAARPPSSLWSFVRNRVSTSADTVSRAVSTSPMGRAAEMARVSKRRQARRSPTGRSSKASCRTMTTMQRVLTSKCVPAEAFSTSFSKSAPSSSIT